MENNPTENDKNVAAATHLSTFSKYFIPFGNFIFPLLLWTVNKDKQFVNEHGRQALNFQLSILVYTLIIGVVCLPFFIIFATDFISLVEVMESHYHDVSVQNIKNLSGYVILFFIIAILLLGLFVFELYAVITATIRASRGEHYKYPLTISFIPQQPLKTQQHEHLS
ncbi:MAG TPA: DUF4870 domain-containing protein [Flavobacteriaceae bacterium]|jgi:hypothetical protein|nr:hypothetical protein [Flavobacteriaceae bacterium]MAY51935.1 hypothetical protein [Flavobacteriaceae bacterium]HBR54813.1 DUF4870 domain-containing protein [Flavobacteriaceae bacterium]HIB48470.1 DUF4870 domain-containing protein [Flavobacteriaceae bacterium]HIN98324.1 DUF4870 domain-containing protein [Flavobacteriaceae bacterium]|tara:strand:- start:337 stop:837 length:501 start_codon:yes stop_codon:yes gene_type:complete